MHVSFIRCRVAIGDLIDFLPSELRDVFGRAILRDSLEEGIYHGIVVSLPALHKEAAVEEASIEKHLPNYRVTPVVRLKLGVDSDAEVIVTGFQYLRHRHHLV